MQSDYEQLRALNVEIGEAESRGDSHFFEDLIAPVFVIRRADGRSLDDRTSFISAVAQSAQRTTEIQSITFFGANRALVECVVTMESSEGTKRFHNIRLFTRQAAATPWMLLAWANEPIE
jgi:hypothetical protein